ncbi:MAG TPA: hypothetical protein VE011_12605 [Candidatus Dormibacteraeota bacterium]|nr:hypothetical protein [Candidatus Dormibacteraeota bacterium]
MRGFLGFTVLALVGLAALVFFVLPTLVQPMVVSAVRSALAFGDQALQIDATVTGPGLLGGAIDEIRIRGSNLDVISPNAGVRIGKLDVTLHHVSIGDHAFRAVSGGLDDVAIPLSNGAPITILRVELTGESNAVTGAAQFGPEQARAFITRCFADAGITVDGVQLEDGRVAVMVFGQRVDLAIGVQDGALVVPDALGAGPITLIQPGVDDQWRLTGTSVTPGSLEIDVVVNAATLLARR